MRKIGLFVALATILGVIPKVFSACDPTLTPSYTSNVGLALPPVNACGWGTTLNGDFSILDASAAILANQNTFTSTNTFTQPVIIQGQPIRYYDASTHYISLQAPATVVTTTFTLPSADGTNGQVLQTNGAGNWSFASPGGASALLNTTNTWTATQAYTSNVSFSSAISVNNGSGTSGQVLKSQGSNTSPLWSNLLPLPTGDTNYIQNRSSLQSGTTFYVSSGTIFNELDVFGNLNIGPSTNGIYPMAWDNANGVFRLGGGTSDPNSWETITAGTALYPLKIIGTSGSTTAGYFVTNAGYASITNAFNVANSSAVLAENLDKTGNLTVLLQPPVTSRAFQPNMTLQTQNTVGGAGTSTYVKISNQNVYVGDSANGANTNALYVSSIIFTLDGSTQTTASSGGTGFIKNQSTLQSGTTAYPDSLYTNRIISSTETIKSSMTVLSGEINMGQAVSGLEPNNIHMGNDGNIYIGSDIRTNAGSVGDIGIGLLTMTNTVTALGPGDNIAIGESAFSNCTGSSAYGHNIAMGLNTLSNCNSSAIAGWNIGIGDHVMGSLTGTTAVEETSVGGQSLFSLKSGNENSAFGFRSLYSLQTGLENTGLGAWALHDVQGSGNVAIGHSAGGGGDVLAINTVDFAQSSIFIGYKTATSVSTDTVTNSVNIGANSLIDGLYSNSLGAGNNTTWYTLALGNNITITSSATANIGTYTGGTNEYTIYGSSFVTHSLTSANVKTNSFTANSFNTTTTSATVTGTGGLAVIAASPSGTYETVFGTAAVSNVQISTNGFVSSFGASPSVSSCGSTPSGSVVGDDKAGVITIGGTAPTACTLTFATVHTGCTMVCNVTDNSLTVSADISSLTTSALTLGFGVGGLAGGNVYYQCTGYGATCR